MKRTTIITITGEDDQQAVDITAQFIPPGNAASHEPPDSGWKRATVDVISLLDNRKPDAVEPLEEMEEQDDRPGEGESHGPECGMRIHPASECTCGKADRISEEQEREEQNAAGA